MQCLNPRRSVQDVDGVTYYGEHSIDGYHETVEVACNRCHTCLARRKRDWAIRCVHENEDHIRTIDLAEGPQAQIARSCFVTLTYDEDNLPDGATLQKSDWQRFMQRLRNTRRSKRIRYLACGEYGSKGRPHYHGILFNVSFHRDSQPARPGIDASRTSENLEKIWGLGRTELAPVTYATAAYVAGYVVKKSYDDASVLRPHDREAYTLVRNPDGTFREALPEFNVASRRPGIARPWIERNLDHVYNHDSVFVDGRMYRPPKFYDKVLAEIRPDHWSEIQKRRGDFSSNNGLSSGHERRARKSLFESKLGQRSQSL